MPVTYHKAPWPAFHYLPGRHDSQTASSSSTPTNETHCYAFELMTIWLVRAGPRGEFEHTFINDSRIYLTWDRLNVNLSTLRDREHLLEKLQQEHPKLRPRSLLNWAMQIWPFAREMQKYDLVVLPLKTNGKIQIGEITGDYQFEGLGPQPFFHWRSVTWIGEAIPRSKFNKDLLQSFNSFLTICRIKRNNAGSRIVAMRQSGWDPDPGA